VRIQRSARERRIDTCLAAVAALLGGLWFLAMVANDPPPNREYLVVDLTIGLAACAGLLVRRRWPVQIAVLLIAATVFSAAAIGAAVVALFTVAVHQPWRVTLAVAGLYAVTVAVVFRLGLSDTRQYVETVVTLVALDAALVTSGMLVRSQRLLVRSLKDRARQAEEEARHTERERLAREMHDVLAHRISLLAVHAGALEVRRTATADEKQAASVIRQCAYEALEDLREVLGILRDNPAAGDPERPQPTLADLPALVEQSRSVGARVTFDNRIAEAPGPAAGIGRHVYRIVQEGLTNARKHAPGAHVRITVDGCSETGLTVELTNALPSTTAVAEIPGAGSGLIGLGERVAHLGGRMERGRTANGEFRLLAWLPWRP
jgi:signal transduction histidine kinase